MSGELGETARLIAKFAANAPVARLEQNFLLLPNQANVMSPILMISQYRRMNLTSQPHQTGLYGDAEPPSLEGDHSHLQSV